MPQEIRLWSVTDDRLATVEPGRLNLEGRLERWLERDPTMLGDDLLIIGKQVPTAFGGYIDLLCIDPLGDLIILELKREKTPREVTAQVLDYASWVRDLSNDDITQLADAYLADRGPLDIAFRQQFDADLPDTINESHRMVVVAARIDDATERIVRYLSDEHGVNINVVTFQYFTLGVETELLARVFLLEPDQVDYRARTRGGSKRRPPLSAEELKERADRQGVGDLYMTISAFLGSVFPASSTSRTALRFKGPWKGSNKVILNLIPGESSPDRGLHYQVYSHRLASMVGVQESSVRDALPGEPTDYSYTANADDEYRGYEGYFRSLAEVEGFVRTFRKSDTVTI
jgi:hypothetical protein